MTYRTDPARFTEPSPICVSALLLVLVADWVPSHGDRIFRGSSNGVGRGYGRKRRGGGGGCAFAGEA